MQSVKRHVGRSFLCVLKVKECTAYKSVSRRAELARRCIILKKVSKVLRAEESTALKHNTDQHFSTIKSGLTALN